MMRSPYMYHMIFAKKNWSNEYVNLAALLHRNQNASNENMRNLCINENGEVEIKSRSPKAIQNIREWTDAFIIFIAI